MLDAAAGRDWLPGFLFSNPIVAGFFAIFMCAVFGAVVFFFMIGGGGGDALHLFEIVRWGVIAGLGIGAVALFVIAVTASASEDRAYHLQFVFGGVLAIVGFVTFDVLMIDRLRASLDTGWVIGGPD
jgi:hypothetical protein